MSVTELPVTRLCPVERLSPERRLAEVERLLSDHLYGVAPTDKAMDVLLAAFAWEKSSPRQARQAWGDLLAEARRLDAIEAGEPEFRDMEPQHCRADYRAAMSDLLDGTATYHGDRTGAAS